MAKLICKNPEIEKDADSTRILSALERQRFATVDDFGIFTVDWQRVVKARELRLIGKKYIEKIRAWAQSAQHSLHVDAANAPQAGATCPHCGNPIILVAPETPRQ